MLLLLLTACLQIGTVFASKEYVAPMAVGVDIGEQLPAVQESPQGDASLNIQAYVCCDVQAVACAPSRLMGCTKTRCPGSSWRRCRRRSRTPYQQAPLLHARARMCVSDLLPSSFCPDTCAPRLCLPCRLFSALEALGRGAQSPPGHQRPQSALKVPGGGHGQPKGRASAGHAWRREPFSGGSSSPHT